MRHRLASTALAAALISPSASELWTGTRSPSNPTAAVHPLPLLSMRAAKSGATDENWWFCYTSEIDAAPTRIPRVLISYAFSAPSNASTRAIFGQFDEYVSDAYGKGFSSARCSFYDTRSEAQSKRNSEVLSFGAQGKQVITVGYRYVD